jgi:hypothetical protein
LENGFLTLSEGDLVKEGKEISVWCAWICKNQRKMPKKKAKS